MEAFVVNILEESLDKKSPILVTADGIDFAFQSYLAQVGPNKLLLDNTLPYQYIRAFSNSKKFTLQCKMLRFQTNHVAPHGQMIAFPIVENSLVEETRQSERHILGQDMKVVCEMLNPFDQETRLSKSVIDLSAHGFSVRTGFASRLFFGETVFEQMQLFIDGKTYAKFKARTIYQRKMLESTGKMRVQVGFRFCDEYEFPMSMLFSPRVRRP